MTPTRLRDLLVVAAVAAVAAYALTRFNYSSLPRLPRLAGLSAALLGIGEAVAGHGLRRRIRDRRDHGRADGDRYRNGYLTERYPGDGPETRRPGTNRSGSAGSGGRWQEPPAPLPPLAAARALSVAKASALAAAALAGLWLGFGGYVVPEAARAAAPADDTATAIVGFVCAGIMLAGALYLEYCCRTPDEPPGGTGPSGLW